VKMYLTFYEKYFKKGTLKPKIEKRARLPLFYCICSDICSGKIANFTPPKPWEQFQNLESCHSSLGVMYIFLVASPAPSYFYFITVQFIKLKKDNETIYQKLLSG